MSPRRPPRPVEEILTSEGEETTPLTTPLDGTPSLTDSPAGLADAMSDLEAGFGPFALDTERAQGIRYSNRAYLLQIRRDGASTHIIDPIALDGQLSGLADLLASDEWILHAAPSDLPSLRDLGFTVPRLFDTELAALLASHERVSLQALVADVLGYGLAKEYSNSDWSARPIPRSLLAYAALDVEVLTDLRRALMEELDDAGRLDWARQEFEFLVSATPNGTKREPWRKHAQSAKVTDQRELAIIRTVWEFREKEAERRDLGPERVLPGRLFVPIAQESPTSKNELRDLLGNAAPARDLPLWWRALEAGRTTTELPSAAPAPLFDFPHWRGWRRQHPEALKRWDIVRPAVVKKSEELALRADVLLKPEHQRALAFYGWSSREDLESRLAGRGARPWQIEQVAEALPRDSRLSD